METIEVREDYLKTKFGQAQELDRLVEVMIFNLSQTRALSPKTKENLEQIRKTYVEIIKSTVDLVTETSILVDQVLTESTSERAKEQAIRVNSIITDLRS